MCVHMYIPLQISNYIFEDVNHLASSLGMSFGEHKITSAPIEGGSVIPPF